MRFSQIRNFVATADAGSMRGAARTLRVAQPDLTRNVRELEEELGLKLLVRSPRGVVPTEAGKAFLARARSIQNELAGMAQDAAQRTEGTVRISFGTGIFADALLPGAIAAFRGQYPKAEVRIVSGFSPLLLTQLREGLIEFAVTVLPPNGRKEKGIKVIPLFRNWRVIVGRRGHPLRSAASLEQLVDADWLVQTLPDMMAEPRPWWFTDLFEKNHLAPPRSVVRCDGNLFNRLLLTTDMIGVLPPYAVLFELGAVEVFKANAQRPASSMYTEYLVLRADSLLTPAGAAMLKAIRLEAQRLALGKVRR